MENTAHIGKEQSLDRSASIPPSQVYRDDFNWTHNTISITKLYIFSLTSIKTHFLSILFRQCEIYGPHYSRSVHNSNPTGALKSLYSTRLSHILEAHLGTGTPQYDSEDGIRTSRVKQSLMTRVLRSVSKKGARQKEPTDVADLDENESVSQ